MVKSKNKKKATENKIQISNPYSKIVQQKWRQFISKDYTKLTCFIDSPRLNSGTTPPVFSACTSLQLPIYNSSSKQYLPCKSQTIHIRVRLLTQRNVDMEISLHHQVSQIRRKLYEMKGVPVWGNYNLVFLGKIMGNYETLNSFYPILNNDSVIECVSIIKL